MDPTPNNSPWSADILLPGMFWTLDQAAVLLLHL